MNSSAVMQFYVFRSIPGPSQNLTSSVMCTEICQNDVIICPGSGIFKTFAGKLPFRGIFYRKKAFKWQKWFSDTSTSARPRQSHQLGQPLITFRPGSLGVLWMPRIRSFFTGTMKTGQAVRMLRLICLHWAIILKKYTAFSFPTIHGQF